MKISYSWLQDYIKTSLSVEEVSDLLTDLGLEVEKVIKQGVQEDAFKGVVVGEVLTCDRHPNADRLNLTTVNVGLEELLQIVCGAPNVVAGQKVPVATVGTVLGSGDDRFKIKKSKIRGVESMGMICSEMELGLGQEASGIMVLDQALEVGKPFKDTFDVKADVVYEIGITPNRSDALSHFGVARDLRAGLIQKGEVFDFFPFEEKFELKSDKPVPDVQVLHPETVTRYCMVQIDQVEVKDSPDWLKDKLSSIGLNSVNNVVDALNYVMFDLGQPFHAFDLDKVKGPICVGHYEQATSMITLEGKDKTLSKEDILIFDSEKPLCIGGVYGGLESSVTLDTNSILIEAAVFDSRKIRRTSKRHGLSSDASFRFERGVDPNMTLDCLKRAVRLICEISSGVVASDVFDHYPERKEPFEMSLSLSRLDDFSGVIFDRSVVEQILSSLEIEFRTDAEDVLQLLVPTYRTDVLREVDVFEEILRVYGYNHVNCDKNIEVPLEISEDGKSLSSLKSTISSFFVGLGFYEIMTNSLTSEAHVDAGIEPVKLLNPLSAELAYLRTSLIRSGLEAISYNVRRQEKNLKFFEIGNQYALTSEGAYREEAVLSVLVTGGIKSGTWNSSKEKVDLFYLKGVLEALLSRLELSFYKIKQDSNTSLSFFVGRDLLVRLQQIPKALTEQFDIKQEVISANLNLGVLSKLSTKKRKKIKSISKFPCVTRDLSMILPNRVNFQEIVDLANQAEKQRLLNVQIFDVYKGKTIPEGKKSYAVSFTLQDQNKTLVDKEIDDIMLKLQSTLETKLSDVEIRRK